MPCRNVGMIVTCLRALVIVGERINIDEELGGGLCCKHGGLPSGVTLLGDQAALAKC